MFNCSGVSQGAGSFRKLGGDLYQEEIYWKQKSQLQWLKEGDEKKNFFRGVANGRKN